MPKENAQVSVILMILPLSFLTILAPILGNGHFYGSARANHSHQHTYTSFSHIIHIISNESPEELPENEKRNYTLSIKYRLKIVE